MDMVYVHKASPLLFYTSQLRAANLRHTESFQAACLPTAFPSKPHTMANARHAIAKSAAERRVQCFTLASAGQSGQIK